VAILKPKHGWYFWIYGVIALVLGVVLWHNVKMMLVKEQMERYLREKYGKEFVVTKVYYVYPYLGGSLEVEGLAYAKDDPDLKFEIAKSASDNDPNTRAYSEGYNQDLWDKQKREEIERILNSELVWVGVSAYYDEEEVYGRTLSISEAEEQFKGRIDLCVNYVLFLDLFTFKKEFSEYKNLLQGKLSKKQIEYLFPLIKKLKDINYRRVNLVIEFYNEDKRNKVVNEIKRYFNQGKYQFYISEEGLLCRIWIRDINSIDKPEDIGSYINTEIADGYINEEILSK